MKTCPFCAEAIQDEAIKCRHCGSDLRPAGIASSGANTPTTTPRIVFSHTGQRYLLGHGADFFGIWDRNTPGPPVERYPRNQDGWQIAWQRFTALEPSASDYAPHQSTQSTNGLAVASLVLGILWLYWIGSILALIFGYAAMNQINRSHGRQGGRGLAVAGVALGWVGIGLFVLFAILLAANS